MATAAKSETTDQVAPKDRSKLYRTLAYFLANGVLGMSVASIGPTLPGLAWQTATTLGAVSILTTARAAPHIFGSTTAGRIYDRAPGHPVLAGALLVIALSMVATSFAPSLLLVIGIFIVWGFAEGFIDVGANTLLVWTHQRNTSTYINGLHLSFGLGAFFIPIIISQVILLSDAPTSPFLQPLLSLGIPTAPGDVSWPYRVMGLILIPVALFFLTLRSPGAPKADEDDARPTGPVDWTLVILFATFLMLYVGAEAGYASWIFSYALRLDLMTEPQAASLVSAFWGMITLGRLVAVGASLRMKPRHVLLIALGGTMASLVLMLTFKSALALWIGTLAIGLSMAPTFPTTYAFADKNIVLNGKISSYFFVGASIGAMSMPWLIGQAFTIIAPSMMLWMVLGTVIVEAMIYMLLVRRVTTQ